MNYADYTKESLYAEGVALSTKFLDANDIKLPVFMTFEEARAMMATPGKVPKQLVYWSRAMGLNRWTNTGLYYDGYAWVNVANTAAPVQDPWVRFYEEGSEEFGETRRQMGRQQSWPGWKTDRTAVGVVTHEVGHYVTDKLNQRFTSDERAELRRLWQQAVKGKRVSGYELTLDEAGAETMRLFITNPALLKAALPKRFNFLTVDLSLDPVPALFRKGWKKTLGNEAYVEAAKKWIGGR